MKAIIGLTADINTSIKADTVDRDYIEAVTRAGGLAIILPSSKDPDQLSAYLDLVDGLIFTGGSDIDPNYYGESPLREVDYISRERDIFEMELFSQAYKRGLPILGICRGMQLINVALGGSLYQDIYSQYPRAQGHNPKEEIFYEPYHRIELKPGSLIHKIMGQDKIAVNSLHHQAIKDLASGLRPTAFAEDGIIESLEGETSNFLLGLQFHPEALSRNYKEFLAIFKSLVEAAAI